MAEHPYMPFFPEKFFGDTAHVPGDVAAFYMVLLAHAWARGGSLPDDDDQLRLMARCPAKRWGQIREALRSFWMLGPDGRLHQKRLDKEWERASRWRQNQQHDGSPNRILKIQVGPQQNGKKSNKIKGRPPRATRARALTHTHTQNSLPYGRENSEGAPAALSVHAHASPAPETGSSKPSDPPVDAAAQQRIAEGLARLAASIVNPDRLNEPAPASAAALEQAEAARKLDELQNTVLPSLSPNLAGRIGIMPEEPHARAA